MDMTTLCLTGWQQPADALSVIAPDKTIHFNYAAYSDVNAAIKAMSPTPRLAIGWSLGGQVLARAVAGGHVRPQTLILLGASYQFLADTAFTHGMQKADFASVVNSYTQDPIEMLKGFHMFVGAGDKHSTRIARALNQPITVWKHGLFWLEELGRFSCNTLDFSSFPATIIIHGINDKVVSPAQAEMFAKHIPSSQLTLLEDCAHAPHLHDTAALKTLVDRYV
jgi:pimeloyl-ACP methyl ester carboxylesterase